MDSEVADAVAQIFEQYPRLAGHNWVVQRVPRKKGNFGYLEFYHPKESRNPYPGRPYIEIYDQNLKGDELKNAIFGDMLHYLPSVDKTFAAMRDQFRQTRTPQQKKIDKEAYKTSQKLYGEDRSYKKWFDVSRLDAYIRGKLAPDINDEWRNMYTPKQEELLQQFHDHLRTGL